MEMGSIPSVTNYSRKSFAVRYPTLKEKFRTILRETGPHTTDAELLQNRDAFGYWEFQSTLQH